MQPRTILCDCDGVLADFVGALCAELTARGLPKTPADIRHWELALSLNADERSQVDSITVAPGFCAELAWYPGAYSFLHQLCAMGMVHVVTSPMVGSPTWMWERKCWFASSALSSDRVHFVSGAHKRLVRGDILIEDNSTIAHAWLEANLDGFAILIDRPWNSPAAKESQPHPRMFRASSYENALELIKATDYV